MGVLLVSDIISRAQDILNDTGAARWTQPEMIRWINDAMREMAVVQPSSTAKTANMQLSVGTRQTLPGGAITTIRITRNMGVSGTVPGPVPRMTTQMLMDLFQPTWHTDTPSTVVANYMRDERVPRIFFVYPPVSAPTYVEIEYSAIPTVVTATTDTLTVDDMYANPIVDYVCYRCFSKDIELPNMQTKAAAHKALFDSSLGSVEQAQGVAEK